MIKKYKIEYHLFKDILDYLEEVIVISIISEIGIVVFCFIKGMFKNDVIGSVAFCLLPIFFIIYYFLGVFIFLRYKITIDFINNEFRYRKLFRNKIYELNKIEFKKRFIKSDNTMNEQVCTLDCIYNGKKIHSINVKAFESITKHKVSELIER